MAAGRPMKRRKVEEGGGKEQDVKGIRGQLIGKVEKAEEQNLKKEESADRTDGIQEVDSSPFLRIPAEIRLQIYEYALDDVTITAGEKEVSLADPELDDRATDGQSNRMHLLPRNIVPMVREGYDSEIIKIGKKVIVSKPITFDDLEEEIKSKRRDSSAATSMDSGYFSVCASLFSDGPGDSTGVNLIEENTSAIELSPVVNDSILLVNKQIRGEVLALTKQKHTQQTTLYVTYPYGILILMEHYPALIRHVKHIVVTGMYKPTPSPIHRDTVNIPDTITKAVTTALGRMVNTMYGSHRSGTPAEFYESMQTLTVRCYFPKEDEVNRCYDKDSPPFVCMSKVPGGTFHLKTWKGFWGHGITMRAGPLEDKEQWDHPAHDSLVKTRSVRPKRHIVCTMRRFRGFPAELRERRRAPNAVYVKKFAEGFWATAFHDEALFAEACPEDTCWATA